MVGQTISHYRVLRAVGRGGMAEIYEAEDLQLGRHVAIKFLSAERPSTATARQRLEREARAASALNHPHICTIHEFGEHAGQRFIVMELLHGAPLRDHLNGRPLSIDECVRLGIEVTDALDAAHRAGIVHRDVTPSNIFITETGQAKVLDFGLAKRALEPPVRAVIGSEVSTHSGPPPTLTSPGAVMGTTAYMSPEQITGEELDARTDVFSFGCVLYEMATGVRPFTGKTNALIFDAILHQAPVAASARNPAVPGALQKIIEEALEKDRSLRYRNAGEMNREIQRLRRDLAGEGGNAAPGSRRAAVRVLAIVAVVSALLGFAYLAWRRGGDGAPVGFARQITSSPGVEADPAISPDGNTIAFSASEADGNDDIWIVDVRGGPPQRVTTDPASDRFPAWLPDGSALLFVSNRGGQAGIWRAPRLAGDAATLLVADADTPAVSPDGREISFTRPNGGYTRLAVMSMADPANVRFITGDADGKWDHSRPAWSPDGETICYDAWDGLWLVPAHGGTARRLTTADARDDSEPAWSSDGRFVYFTSLRGRQAALWKVSREGGTPVRVTVGSGIERTPRVSRDGRLIAFSTSTGTRDLVIRDLRTGQESQFGSSRDEMFPAFAPDARTVYFVSDRWGAFDIWAQEIVEGRSVGGPRRIGQADGVESHLACSGDGRWLAYYRILNERRDIFVIPTSGGAPQRFTADRVGAVDPAWSPDGRRLAFSSERDGSSQIWVQSIQEGRPVGAPTRITSGIGVRRALAWSPDGATIAYVNMQGRRSEVAVVPVVGSSSATVPSSGPDAQFVRWNGSGDTLLVKGRWGRPQFELRALNRDGSVQPGFQAVQLGAGASLVQFDLSRDGRFVVFTSGVLEGDIWVLDGGSRRF